MTQIKIFMSGLVLLVLASCSTKSKPEATVALKTNVQKVIFETDMGNDIDDALALDMLYKYMDHGSIDLLAIMTNKEGRYSAEYIDIMNTWYGYPDIPIGIVGEGVDCETDAVNYAKQVCLMKDEKGEPLFTRSLKEYDSLSLAVRLYREILAGQPDSSVTVISVGFSTNIARLLDSPSDDISPLTGKELVERKVKNLCAMAGCFDREDFYEYNVVKDIPAAMKVFEEWPTSLITSPFEVGIAITYPATSIENDFNWTQLHPMVEAYKVYQPMPYDRPTWDLTSVLYAVEGDLLMNTSPSGYIHVSEKGATSFSNDPNGKRHYFTVDSMQADNIRRHFIEIITRQPKKYSNTRL